MSTENLYAGRCAVAFRGSFVGVAAACPKLERKKRGAAAADLGDPSVPEWMTDCAEPAAVTVEFAASEKVAELFFGGGADILAEAAGCDLLETSGALELYFFEAGGLLLTFPRAVLSQSVECGGGGSAVPVVRVVFTVFPGSGRVLVARSFTPPSWAPTPSGVSPREALAALCSFLNVRIAAADPLEAWRVADGVRRLGAAVSLTGEKPDKNGWRRTLRAEAVLEYPARSRLEAVADALVRVLPSAVSETGIYAVLEELDLGGASPARGGFAGTARFSLLLSR